MSSQAMALILEKIASKDKDFRYMATSDLLNELQKDSFKTQDTDQERKLVMIILQQLEDPSGDISSLAVKCLGVLVHRVSETSLELMVKQLTTKLLNPKKDADVQRETAAIGIKAVVQEVSSAGQAAVLVQHATGPLLSGVQREGAPDVTNECLDILNEVITKYGSLMTQQHAQLTGALLPLLDDRRSPMRKRAIGCLAALAASLPDGHLQTVNTAVVAKLDGKLKPEAVKTYVQAVGAISRTVGYRFAAQLPQGVPLVISHCGQASEEDDELREACLRTLEAFVMRSAHETRPFLDQIMAAGLRYVTHDPNYQDGMDEDGGSDEEEEEDYADLDDEDDIEDEDDVSWKVRRAAAKLLSAIILNYADALSEIFPAVAPVLVQRFREREENVKMDVFTTFVDLLRQVGVVSKRFEGVQATRPVDLLKADVPTIVKAVAQQLRDKSQKTKIGVFLVLKELATLLPGSISVEVARMVPGIEAALNDKSSTASNMKIAALQFLRLGMQSTGAAIWQQHVPKLAGLVAASAEQRYYKVSAEALRVIAAMVLVIRPQGSTAPAAELKGTVEQVLFPCVMRRLAAQDQDQEVKEAAIACMATLLASLGDVLAREVPAALKVMLERLKNEVTRLTATKGFATLAGSPLALDLSPVLDSMFMELTRFLRMANRPLRQAALQALEALTSRHGSAVSPTTLAAALQEVVPLLSDGDLLIAALSLNFCGSLVRAQPREAQAAVERVLPPTLALIKFPLLQGTALHALQSFLTTLAASGVPAASFGRLMPALQAAGREPAISKAAQLNIASCMAVLCGGAANKDVAATVSGLLQGAAGKDESTARLSLFSLGAIGRSMDLSKQDKLQGLLTSSLASPSEEVKGAAAFALGGVTIGAMGTYLPFVLQQIQKQAGNPKEQYLLLRALNETIVSLAGAQAGASAAQLTPDLQDQVLQLLLQSTEGEDECRQVVAECLGHTALLHADKVLPVLLQQAQAQSGSKRAVAVTAVKYCIQDKPSPVDAQLHGMMGDLLGHIGDEDRHVRKAAVQTLTMAAHNKPGLILDHLPKLLPLVYEQTKFNSGLVREMDLGPFKHRVDDGLELRKAAFECLDMLLDSCKDRIQFHDFIQRLVDGLQAVHRCVQFIPVNSLQDQYDVKLPCHLLLGKLAATAGEHLLPELPAVIGPLDKTLSVQMKQDAVKQEVDRHDDMIRSCLRAVEVITRIRGASHSAPFQQFMQKTVLPGVTGQKFAAIKEERAELEGLDSTAMDTS